MLVALPQPQRTLKIRVFYIFINWNMAGTTMRKAQLALRVEEFALKAIMLQDFLSLGGRPGVEFSYIINIPESFL